MVEDAACIMRKLAQCTNELQNEICIMRIINVILTQSMFSIFRIYLQRQVVYIFFSTSYILFCVTAFRCTFWKMETSVKYFCFHAPSLPGRVYHHNFPLAQQLPYPHVFLPRNICWAHTRACSTKEISVQLPLEPVLQKDYQLTPLQACQGFSASVVEIKAWCGGEEAALAPANAAGLLSSEGWWYERLVSYNGWSF